MERCCECGNGIVKWSGEVGGARGWGNVSRSGVWTCNCAFVRSSVCVNGIVEWSGALYV
jgi:hypothetical protein